MTKQLFVLSNPKEGFEDEFNDWYDNVHLAEVCQIPGVVSAQRYEAASVPGSQIPPPKQRYLAAYQLDGDPGEVLAELMRRIGTGEIKMADNLDLTTVDMQLWEPRG